MSNSSAMNMNSHRHCDECGGVLSDFWPTGLCALCALGEPASSARPALAGDPIGRFGDYELIEELARGGMGVVYRARQVSLNRVVAVKLLALGPGASPDAIRRLRAEAVAAAALKHSNIVAIHEVGVDRGQHYLAMDFVEGVSLAQFLRNGPLPSRVAALYTRKVAAAISHAHERGILHRDLKPANILIDQNDEPQVTDFGLAKRIHDEVSMTQTGEVLGSPNYMSPEQARGDAQIGPACDIYGMGALLYHLLTGRAPVHGENVPDTIRRVVEWEPIAPRVLNPALPIDLETICLKCLEKSPEKRYPTARDLGDELDRFLRNEPIRARRLNVIARSGRWAMRHRMRALALALLATIALGSPLVSLEIAHERGRAEQQLYLSNIALGFDALESRNFLAAREAIREIENSPAQRKMMGWEARYLRSVCQRANMIRLGQLDAFPAEIAFAPGDKLLASITEDGRVQLWDLELRRRIDSWAAHGTPARTRTWRPFHALAFNQAGDRLFTSGADGLLRMWNIRTHEPEFTTDLGGAVVALSLSLDGAFLIATVSTGAVAVFEVAGDSLQLRYRWHTGPGIVSGAAMLPDSQHVLVTVERTIEVWKLERPSASASRVRSIDQAGEFTLDPASGLIVSLGPSGDLSIRSLPDLRELRSFPAIGGIFRLSPKAGVLASGSADGKLTLLDESNGDPLRVLQGHTDSIRAMAFSHDGKYLVTAGCDRLVGLWDVTAALRPERVVRHGHKVQDIRFLKDSLHFLTLAREMGTNSAGVLTEHSSIKLWHAGNWAVLSSATLEGFSLHHNQLGLSADEKIVAVNDHGIGRILSMPNLAMAVNPVGQNLAYSADGKKVAFFNGKQVGTADGTLQHPAILGAEERDVSTLAISPDGKTIVTRQQDSEGEFTFWETGIAGKRATGDAHLGTTVHFSFSPDSRLLATASWDGTVGLWEVSTRRHLGRLRGHSDSVDAVAFSADGRILATGAQDGTVRLWHAATHREIGQLKVSGGVSALAFSPDGQWLIGGGFDGILHFWRAP